MENSGYNSLTQRLISNGILPNSDSRAFGANFFVENSNENQEITFPNKLKVIKEVTDDVNYKNSSLANINRK